MTILKHISVTSCAIAALLVSASGVAAYSIPSEQVEQAKIYYGSPESFEKPAKIRFEDIVKATPEYDEVRREKLERGTGRYWVLLSKASDRANRAIQQVGHESEYDLIALAGYLGELEPAIVAEDITDLVIETMSAGANQK